MTYLRPIRPLDIGPVDRAPIVESAPAFGMLSPVELCVDEDYQRGLSERSRRLIAKIVAKWDWARFKPPIVVNVDGAWHIVDGQHTAIAAATHGGIDKIPVMIIGAKDTESRARAFVGHNRDRVAVTPIQIHHAAVAAGDEDALTIEQVCKRAGVTLLPCGSKDGVYEIGATTAISTIRTLVARRGAMGARQALEALVIGECAPIAADDIKAAEELLHGKEYKGTFAVTELGAIFRASRSSGALEPSIIQLAMSKKIPRWRAMVIFLFNRSKR
ncbi:hypothetical protein [Methylocystis parvus]|uniref:hypothetical protein n=1 Tax=Methylocystis parvus TaxID=134 RepID=UPI003C762809